ncbi:MAG: hypothetical protein HOY69_07860 [Streptomyces sp.]|nr:hypothetical protein [Streptomyces sp.]
MRALIAIGALVSAVGIPLEKADAVYKTHEVPDLVEADPGVSSLVNTAPATDVPTRTTTARTPVHASTAGQWTPAAKKTAVVATPALTPGSGRHRSPHPGLHKGWKNGGGHGKHRRQDGTPSQNGQHPHQTGRADKVELQQGVNQRGSFKIGLSVRVSTPLTGVLL